MPTFKWKRDPNKSMRPAFIQHTAGVIGGRFYKNTTTINSDYKDLIFKQLCKDTFAVHGQWIGNKALRQATVDILKEVRREYPDAQAWAKFQLDNLDTEVNISST